MEGEQFRRDRLAREEALNQNSNRFGSEIFFQSNNSIESPTNSKRGFFAVSPNPFRQNDNSSVHFESSHKEPDRDNFAIGKKMEFGDETPIRRLKMHEFATNQKSLRLANEAESLTSRNSKGLKSLSQNVYDIVHELKVTTYKQVANKLIQQVSQKQSIQCQEKTKKDEQNIKRRAYDALNVLIATAVLRKEGKKVAINVSKSRKSATSFVIQKEEKEIVRKELQMKILKLSQKKVQLRKLRQKKQIINRVVNRNIQQQVNQDQIFKFPLIVIPYESKDFSHFARKGNKISLSFLKRFQILGDIDMLVRIPGFQNQEAVENKFPEIKPQVPAEYYSSSPSCPKQKQEIFEDDE